MNDPVRMRADQLSVGDLVPDAYLPHRFNKGPAEVRFVADDGEGHTFFAFRYPNGQHDSTTVLSESALEIWPAPAATGLDYSRPADDPQPSGGREPMHTGAWTDGGLVDETEVRCASSDPHGPHRTTFAPEMGIANGICPGRCTQVCIDMAVDGAPQDARKGWHDDDCPAVMDIADVR